MYLPCIYNEKFHLQSVKERGHTYTPDNGGADRLVAEEMKQSKSVGMLERELGA